MQKIFRILMMLTLCLPVCGFEFSRNGKALCSIAVPEQMTDLEIIAKDDLSYFLNKITGAEFQVVSEKKVQGPAIYVGFTEYARKHGINRKILGQEEWIIKCNGQDLILTGGGKIGPFYAVTSLLRKMGCYTLTMDQEIYPHKPTLSLADCEERRSPAFAGRAIYDSFPFPAYYDHITYEDAKAYNMYLLRNFRNPSGQEHKNFLPYYTGDINNISQCPCYHSLILFIPPEKYFKNHPEYYSMDENGRRVKPRGLTYGGSLCMSNPEVADVVASNMLASIRKERQTIPAEFHSHVYDFSLLDNFGYICHCPACKKIIRESGGADKGGTTVLMLKQANKIARTIAREFPDIILRIFAYSSCQESPSIPIKIEKNILIQYCDLFASGDAYRPLTNKFNKKTMEQLTGWHKTGARLMVWDYWNLPSNYPRPETVIDTIQPDLRLFRKLGVESLFIEAELQKFCPQNFMLMQYFIGAQLMENPDQDVEKLIDIYQKGYYGPAAALMKEYLEILRKGVKEHPGIQITIRVEHWKYLNTEFLLHWYQKMTALEKTLPEKSIYRFRLQMEKLPLLWTVCQAANSYKKAFAEAGLNMKDLKKECSALSRAFFYRHNYEGTKNREKSLQKHLDTITLELPVPELFSKIPEDQMRIFGYPDYRTVISYNVNIVKDAEALCGKAVKSAFPNLSRHGVGKMYKVGKHTYCATQFFLSNIEEPGAVSLLLDKVPQDEKYHWYRFPKTFDMKALAYFWGHGWGLQVDISRVYVISDGVSDNNHWDGWFRAKFTGPAYVPGSKKENAIWYDYLILTRPGEKSLSNYPHGGLIQ